MAWRKPHMFNPFAYGLHRKASNGNSTSASYGLGYRAMETELYALRQRGLSLWHWLLVQPSPIESTELSFFNPAYLARGTGKVGGVEEAHKSSLKKNRKIPPFILTHSLAIKKARIWSLMLIRTQRPRTAKKNEHINEVSKNQLLMLLFNVNRCGSSRRTRSIQIAELLHSPSPLDHLKYHFHDSFNHSSTWIVRLGVMQFKLHGMERFEEGPDEVSQELPVYILDGAVEEPDFVNLLIAVKDARSSQKEGAKLEPLSHSSCTTDFSTRLSPDEATTVVSVARECGSGSFPKRALYELVRTDCFGQKGTSVSTSSGVSNAMLSPSDYHHLLQAREILISLWISVAAAPFPYCLDAVGWRNLRCCVRKGVRRRRG
ncbi:hypothetical protein BDP27DRAFT_1366205 [Rhodocollybia butyracea]|uniref:Uncharacterized protein n=1 Tax=Rhodocollybia butyracea TaxID=206335 RepID=A0A9P5PM10_9AGAR|nr:hypothetical protein BDP27DRAFT_1366205 [Rhodocollybia butyracea]